MAGGSRFWLVVLFECKICILEEEYDGRGTSGWRASKLVVFRAANVWWAILVVRASDGGGDVCWCSRMVGQSYGGAVVWWGSRMDGQSDGGAEGGGGGGRGGKRERREDGGQGSRMER